MASKFHGDELTFERGFDNGVTMNCPVFALLHCTVHCLSSTQADMVATHSATTPQLGDTRVRYQQTKQPIFHFEKRNSLATVENAKL